MHPLTNRHVSLAIVLTNYNTWDLALRCVEACFHQDRGRFDSLLIYDDCSQVEFTGSFPDGARLYRGCPNRGLIKSLNVAFQLVTDDVIVLFDSDAYPTTPFCDAVRTMFEKDDDLGLVALRTIGRSGRPTESYTPEPNVWSLLLGQALHGRLGRWLDDRSGRISVFTCAMAVRKSAFDELGGFDEQFDWLDLDHDLSMRMNRSKWKVAIVPDPRVFHEGGGTPQLTRQRVLRFYKNRWYLLNKFNRVPLKKLTKILILTRLYIEYAILRIGGPILFPDEAIRNDKVTGRRELIRLCSLTF